MGDTEMIKIEVAYALYEEQFLDVEEVAANTTVGEALKNSKMLQRFPNLNIEKVGIFGKMVKHEQVLRQGDRIEIYRPLKVDPKDRRREKVAKEREQQKRK